MIPQIYAGLELLFGNFESDRLDMLVPLLLGKI